MAENLVDGEFWLPPRFLADEDDDNKDALAVVDDDKGSFGYSSFTRSSNSPVESVISSTETESDEDDYSFTGLTRQLNHTTLHDKHAKVNSPQSTLSPVHGGKATNVKARDLLFATAAEVDRTRVPHPQQGGAAKNNDFGFYPNKRQQQSFSRQQLEALKFEQMRHQQVMRQRAAEAWAAIQGKGNKPLRLAASAWPSLQQAQELKQQGKKGGVKDVIPGGKTERTGTGVFLPLVRPPVDESCKQQPGYWTGLVPDIVVQSRLDVGAVHQGGYDTCGASMRGPGGNQERYNDGKIQPEPVVNSQEFQLPPEWTY